MPFHIIDVERDTYVINQLTGEFLTFETGEAAQMYAKEQARANEGRKYRVKRVLDTRWKQREQRKFDEGKYTPLSWANDGWWRTTSAHVVWKDQFPHISMKEPGMIAFTESEEKGMDNLRTRMKPGRYLEKYFGEHAKQHGVSIQALAKKFEAQFSVKQIHFAATPDEIEDVYRRGPDSCMSSDEYRRKNGWGYPERGKWPNDMHACRVYGAGDLQVAYLLEKDDRPKSKVISRSLVWPAKKTFSRCYGDEVRLKQMLMSQGYTSAPPIGAKILRITIPVGNKKPRQFLVPYIDRGDRSGAGSLAIKDMKDHMLIVLQEPGTYPASSTSGISGGRYMADGSQDDGAGTCARCNAEDIGTQRVFRGNAPGDYQHWCETCTSSSAAFRCAADGRFYDAGLVEQLQVKTGHSNIQMWSRNSFASYGFVCSKTGENWHRDYRSVVRVSGKGKTAFWCRDAVVNHAFKCQYVGEYYSNDQKVVMANGQDWSKQAVDHAGFTCTECEKTYATHESVDCERKICLTCNSKKGVTGTPVSADDAIDALITSLRNQGTAP